MRGKRITSELLLHFSLSWGTHQTPQNSGEALCPDREDTIAPTGVILREAGSGQVLARNKMSSIPACSILSVFIYI